MTALALDVGGTKLAAAQVSETGVLGDVKKTPTPETGVWDACAELLRAVAGDSTITAVGIASAGPVDTVAGTTAPINIPDWHDGFGIVAAAQSLFPSATIYFAMDGACATWAEHLFGAARGVPNVLGMVVSTGIGGGIVLDGKMVSGRTGNPGHVGHIVVPGSTEECSCGGIGCVETVASGPSSVRWAKLQGWEGDDGEQLAKSADAGDSIAVAALQRAGTALGQAIASAGALLDMDLVVVGGGFAQAGPMLWDPLYESIARHARLNFLTDLRVVAAELGGLGTLTGAGALTLERT
ncbi:ROK family protein [Antrihabitans cavernicola]|uniref:ROK family protein n=1 Tax=Antrihabitans cavernicola TaxID=2495913 RepID=A0A5A7S1R8_9NOCA|nr:ROK family protein [Spelaeibacter cavernicola]KAA0017399.1 ROK family protein [Spelaeibacter cavernicola]